MTPSTLPKIIVVGGGLAGTSLALRLADSGQTVLMVAKGTLTEGSTLYAQGGIAAVLGRDDSIRHHTEDTLKAGAGLCHPEVVDFVVKHGPDNIRWLIDKGVGFSRQDNSNNAFDYHLAREGGHSHRRVIHVDDATGRAVENTLEALVRAHDNIHLLENHIVIDLVTTRKLGILEPDRCVGLYALDILAGKVITMPASFVVLATGGASKAYLYTSNPDTSTGDGIAMAWRAGCRVVNMEFVQFHPTCLYHPQAKSFLISEAVRGEGGRLLLPDKTHFMQNHDPRGELAPRDIVARAIDYEMKRGGWDHVYLDISHRSADFVRAHFPNIHGRCLEFGFDMTKEPVPVVPAAHYTCGGVMVDLHGHTDLTGLYAIGECTFTGLHGANRLASNSLLECLVFARAAATDIMEQLSLTPPAPVTIPPWDESRVTDPDEQIVVSHNWDELRRFMWDYVGIVRTNKRLQRAMRRVELLKEEIRDYYSNFKINSDLLELRNLVQVAELTIRSALSRKESRGLHYTLNYPHSDALHAPKDTIMIPDNLAGSSQAWRPSNTTGVLQKDRG